MSKPVSSVVFTSKITPKIKIDLVIASNKKDEMKRKLHMQISQVFHN